MIDLLIDNLTFGGRGVGRVDGKAIFVPYVVPGEKIRCQVTREHKRYSEAELVTVLEPSPQRIKPECPVFGECGGCQWQHLPYQQQLEWKERIFRESLQRTVPLDDALFAPTVASPAAWNYRCRAQIRCRMTQHGFVTGFYRSGSHFVVDIEQCPLLDPEINQIMTDLKPRLAGFALAHRLPQLDFCTDGNGQVSVVVYFLETDLQPLRELLAPVASKYHCAIYLQQARKNRLVELFPGTAQAIHPLEKDEMLLNFPPGGFIQVNLEQNRQLVADVVAHAGTGQKILDLYCGVGNFSLPVAKRAVSVVGIEAFAPAIAAAVANAERNGLRNTSFMARSAEKNLSQVWGDDGFDTVILDPPRSGALEVARQLSQLKPQQIIYVSCDPMTLARDLKSLVAGGYRPVSFQPYDMFPQTGHIESVTVLEI